LRSVIHARCVSQSGLSTHVNDVCTLRRDNASALDCGFSGKTDALAIPRIRREIDHAHDGGPEARRVEMKRFVADEKLLYARASSGAVLLQQTCKMFECQHEREIVNRNYTSVACRALARFDGVRLVRLAGLEPTTLCLEGRCSIQLSYRRDLDRIDYLWNRNAANWLLDTGFDAVCVKASETQSTAAKPGKDWRKPRNQLSPPRSIRDLLCPFAC
jgi:hypothetical protein